jgi:hypothetical protein
MIHVLANLFRQFHHIFGITAPPPNKDERSFVFMWLGIIAFIIAWCGLLVYLMRNVFPHMSSGSG